MRADMRQALAELATATVITPEPARERRLRIALIQSDVEAAPPAVPVPPVAETTGAFSEERGRG